MKDFSKINADDFFSLKEKELDEFRSFLLNISFRRCVSFLLVIINEITSTEITTSIQEKRKYNQYKKLIEGDIRFGLILESIRDYPPSISTKYE